MQYFQQCVSSQIIVVNDDVCLRRNFFIMKHTNLVNEREQSHFMERCGNFSSVYSLHLSFHEPSPIFFYPFVAHTTLNRDCNVFFFLFFYHWAKIFCLPQLVYDVPYLFPHSSWERSGKILLSIVSSNPSKKQLNFIYRRLFLSYIKRRLSARGKRTKKDSV